MILFVLFSCRPSKSPSTPLRPVNGANAGANGQSPTLGAVGGDQFTITQAGNGMTSPGNFEVDRMTPVTIQYSISGGAAGSYVIGLTPSAPTGTNLSGAQSANPIVSWTPDSLAPQLTQIQIFVRDIAKCQKAGGDCAISPGVTQPNSSYDTVASSNISLRAAANMMSPNSSSLPFVNSTSSIGGDNIMSTLLSSAPSLLPMITKLLSGAGGTSGGSVGGSLASGGGSCQGGSCTGGGSCQSGSCGGE